MTQQEQLEAEFPSEMIRTTPKGGQRLSYVPVSEVIQRLNDVLGAGGWKWEVSKIWRDNIDIDWVLAYGNLTATIDGEINTRGGSGGVKIKETKAGAIVDLGDEFKGAESDALKKAAQRFGVALYLARTPEAVAYEAPVIVRDPVAEGWESAERAQTYWAELKNRMKALPEDEQEGVRKFIAAEGILQPPTHPDYEKLAERVSKVEKRLRPQRPTESPESQPTTEEAELATKEPSEASGAVEAAFEGSTQMASKDELETLAGYLNQFRNNNDLAATRAFNKYTYEKAKQGWPEDRREWTSSQVSEALDFIENM